MLVNLAYREATDGSRQLVVQTTGDAGNWWCRQLVMHTIGGADNWRQQLTDGNLFLVS